LPERDLDLLIRAAEQAGEIARDFFAKGFEVSDKGGGQGPVTEADLAIDVMLRETLLAARPDYGWLSEETEDDPARLTRENVFIVDPIDGTRSFVDGRKTFAHSLAISRNGIITEGVVLMPMRDFTYAARLGEGAYLNGKPITASQRPTLDQANVIAARPQLDAALWPGGVPSIQRHYRPSLAYRMCLVAEGRFDGMVTLRDAWEWDIAAGALICKEAGTAISDRLGQPLSFNNAHPTQAGVLAGSNGVHRDMLERLQARP